VELRVEGGGFGVLWHGLASFCVGDPSDRGEGSRGGRRGGPSHAPPGSPVQRGELSGQGVETGRRHRPDSATPHPPGEKPAGAQRRAGNQALKITPSGLLASSTASSSSSTFRTVGPRSGWCTASKSRDVMRASISCRLSVLSISSRLDASMITA
jgi:hypothetical protein